MSVCVYATVMTNQRSLNKHIMLQTRSQHNHKDPNSFDYGTVRYGKLSFVDLAGSERVRDSRSEGAMLRETLREALTEAYMMGAQNILGRL